MQENPADSKREKTNSQSAGHLDASGLMDINSGIRAAGFGLFFNFLFSSIKIFTGLVGNSYALIADGIESLGDMFSSIAVWIGLSFSSKPPDENHPFGHGKAESISAVVVSLFLMGSAGLIAFQSIKEILSPHQVPAWFTLPVLVLVIIAKESIFRYMNRVGDALSSNALQGDAWHHRADALTSLAAGIGISIALWGGPKYASADDWAALAACSIMIFNAGRFLKKGIDEVMDASVPTDLENEIRQIAEKVKGVVEIEKCRIRKSGISLLMDIHVEVNGDISVKDGHDIAHSVKEALCRSHLPIDDVVVHIEPHFP